MGDIVKDVEEIKKRNNRVELDKAWETSWTRRIFIGAMTFIIASIWLKIIDGENIFLKALIPTGGYILSTLSLPAIKKIWIGNT